VASGSLRSSDAFCAAASQEAYHRRLPSPGAFGLCEFTFFLAPRIGLTRRPPRVEMIKAEQVDVYGIQVIRADQY
jgi:hypothetical protein